MLAGNLGSSAERTLLAAGVAALVVVAIVAFVLLPSDAAGLAVVLAAFAITVMTAIAVTLLRRSSRALRADFAAIDRANRDLERRLAERSANLQEANDEIQRVAEVIERDLRPPLSNIMGFTGELEALRNDLLGRAEGTIEDPATKALRQDYDGALWFIRSSVSKMDRLVGAVVDLAQIGQREFRAEIVDLDRLVRTLAADFSNRAEKGGVRLAVGKLPSIVSDRGALEQILASLLDNAVKFLRDVPGHIAVTATETEAGMIEVAVTDNGRGIAAVDQPRIFDLFRRAGTPDRPGEGIGLAVARTLVRRLGGSIRVESELDRGSTFTVVLPKSRAP
ncbi:MAG: HAMP domain-containing histidine kinase [Rhodospirillaceae bacterium]|nr:HAMP domain-containing histidine kinase [Rhodospirillaceae bacterium]